MDVIVERFQRRKIVSNPASPMLYYLRQKPKTCGTVDIDVLAASIQKNCAMTKGDVKHVIEALVEEIQGNLANGDKVKLNQLGTFHMTFRCPGMEASDKCTVRNISKVNIRFIPDKELKLVNGSTAVTRSECGLCARQARGGRLRRRQSRRWFRRRLRRRRRPGRKSAGIKKE